jgi:hypothetical protein
VAICGGGDLAEAHVRLSFTVQSKGVSIIFAIARGHLLDLLVETLGVRASVQGSKWNSHHDVFLCFVCRTPRVSIVFSMHPDAWLCMQGLYVCKRRQK